MRRRRQVGADMARDAGLDLVQHRHGRADLPGRAVAALVAVVLHEGGLHRVQVLGRAQALDRGDAVALVHHGQRQAGIDPPPVDDDRAGAALAVIAALLGAGEMQMLAQRIEQRGPRVELELARLAVHVEGTFDIGTVRDGSWAGAGVEPGCGRHRASPPRKRLPDQQVTPGYFEVAELPCRDPSRLS